MTASRPIIAGTAVLYDTGPDFVGNLATYVSDLDFLVVIDNSPTRNPAIQSAVEAHTNAEYLSDGVNKGVAAALNLAARRAQAVGAHYLLTMDQDSGFAAGHFRTFRDAVFDLPDPERLAIAAPNFLSEEGTPANHLPVISETVITSGSIVHLGNFQRLGGFDEALFIDEVDHDYCLRASDSGLSVITLSFIHLRHNLGEATSADVFGHRVRWNIHNPSRHYYIVRNGLYMLWKHRRRHLLYGSRRLGRVARTIAAALILAPQKKKRLIMVLRAIGDFAAGRMGRRNDLPVRAPSDDAP